MQQKDKRELPKLGGPEEKAAHILNVVMAGLLGLALYALIGWVIWGSAMQAWTERRIMPGLTAVVFSVVAIQLGVGAVRFMMRAARRRSRREPPDG